MSQDLQKRYKHNSNIFIISYALMGIMSGMVLDTLITFLSEVAPAIEKSYSSFVGIATLITALLVLLAPKVGYKKLLILGPVLSIVSLVLLNFTNNQMVLGVITLSIIAGAFLFDAILPPFLTQYTSPENRDVIFSRALYTNVAGMTLATLFGGVLIVWRFASRLGISYGEAKALSSNLQGFTTVQASAYTIAHKDVLLMFVVVSILALVPLLFLKEVPQDYKADEKDGKKAFNWKVLANKYVILFLVYNFLIRFGASLITPYFSVYLGSLGIDRATVSMLVTAQYAAQVMFMMFSPLIVKKFGKVVALGGLALCSIPFMIVIANGDAFGPFMIFAVGVGLFLRSGFMNAANPIAQSLPMEFVTKELRPAYSSVIFVVQAIAQTLAGIFTASFLFNDNVFGASGYKYAYYITAIIYLTAITILLTQFTKKYNRSVPKDDVSEEKAA